jgi:phosphomannomutase/phosphoglucomutase
MSHPSKLFGGENQVPRLFGTSGIRGLVDEFLTPELAAKVGLSFATLLGNTGNAMVGRDVRPQSQLIQNALMSGLLAGGIDVMDCGLVPTPAVLFAMRKTDSKAAVIVTGSHTAPATTGLLFFLSDTGEMDERGERHLESIYRTQQWRRLPWNQLGSLNTFDVLETYLTEIQKYVPRLPPYRVVVDPGNGSACLTLGHVLEILGCEVVTINGQPDGTFPSRPPYPQPSNLAQLSSVVRETKADIGVGTDSDGDRALFATESGQVLWGDVTAALFARNELTAHKGGRVVTTVNTSSLIRLLCREHNGILTVTKVGPPAMAKALRNHRDAIFAAEESGKYIWPEVLLYGDAALASGKLLRIMEIEHKSLEQLQSDLPRLYQLKRNVPCPDELKSIALECAAAAWRGREDTDVSTIEGLKVTDSNGSWFLLRASGTEPVLRCYAESSNAHQTEQLLDESTELAQNSISEASRRYKK